MEVQHQKESDSRGIPSKRPRLLSKMLDSNSSGACGLFSLRYERAVFTQASQRSKPGFSLEKISNICFKKNVSEP
jgi:hypothetical protein